MNGLGYLPSWLIYEYFSADHEDKGTLIMFAVTSLKQRLNLIAQYTVEAMASIADNFRSFKLSARW